LLLIPCGTLVHHPVPRHAHQHAAQLDFQRARPNKQTSKLEKNV
jgi:hypothetical protein